MAELKTCSSNFYSELCGVNITVDPQTTLGSDDDKVLIIGQLGVGATISPDTVSEVLGADLAAQFGANSMLTQQVEEFLEGCPTADVCVYTVANDLDVSTTTVQFEPSVGACVGVVYLWVNGRTYQTAFNVDGTVLAAAFQQMISASDLTLSVTQNLDTITITTIGTGAIGGFLDVRSEYGVRSDLTTTCDVDITIVNTAVAVEVPNIDGIADIAVGAAFVLNPFTDDAAIAAVDKYLCSQWSGGANSRAYGVFYGSHAEAVAFGNNANSALISYMAIDGGLTPPYLETTYYGCLMYAQLNCSSDDIASSTTGKVMQAMLAPETTDRFSDAQKADLVENGMGYFNVNRINNVAIGRAVTTYTVRGDGTPDISLREVNMPAMIACISSLMRTQLEARFTGYAFRSDGVIPSGTGKVTSVAGIRNFIITQGQLLSDRNLIQDLASFVESLQVTIEDDTGCIAVAISPKLVTPFCCMNVTLQTIS